MIDQNYQVGERRPIASRQRRIWQTIAHLLARKSVNPNAISVAGMLAGILAGLAIASTSLAAGSHWLWWAGAAMIQLRLLANMLDGMVAVESGRASRVGELYNEVPDRVSDSATLIGAGYALGGDVLLGLIAACVALFVAYVRVMGKAAGASHEFCGPMAKQHRMFVLTLTCIYLGFVPRSFDPAWGPGGRRGLVAIALWLIIVGGVFTALRRLYRISAMLKKVTP